MSQSTTTTDDRMLKAFQAMKGQSGTDVYEEILCAHNYEKSKEILEVERARAIYMEMAAFLTSRFGGDQ